MSNHDPLCILYPRIDGRSRGFCICDVIRQARDEALAGEVALASESYARAMRDCIAAVEALPHDGYCVATDPNYVRLCECLRADALAALRGLGGSDE